MGPTFGESASCYDRDLTVWYSGYGSNLDLGYVFKCHETVNKNNYLAGVSPFQVSELEVFKVNL